MAIGAKPAPAGPERATAPGAYGRSARLTGFFWQWAPFNFDDRSVFFHVNADPDGKPWNTRAVILPDGAGPEGGIHVEAPRLEGVTRRRATRHAERALLKLPLPDGEAEMTLEPVGLPFLMR